MTNFNSYETVFQLKNLSTISGISKLATEDSGCTLDWTYMYLKENIHGLFELILN